jgi:hypothetical protein
MSPERADIAIPTFLKCIRQRLEQAGRHRQGDRGLREAG